MSQLIMFPPAARVSTGEGAATLIVGVHDDLLPRTPTFTLPTLTFEDGERVRYARQSVLERTGVEADEWVCPITPSATGRRVILETVAGEVIEQDREGRLHINGDRPSDPLLAVACPSDGYEGSLRLGACAAFLVGAPDAEGYRFRIGMSAPVLWVFSMADVQADAPRVHGWMRLACSIKDAREVAM